MSVMTQIGELSPSKVSQFSDTPSRPLFFGFNLIVNWPSNIVRFHNSLTYVSLASPLSPPHVEYFYLDCYHMVISEL